MSFFPTQFDDNVYQARRNAHKAIEMCVHMSPGTEGVVDAKLVPVLVAKLLNEEDEIKVFKFFAHSVSFTSACVTIFANRMRGTVVSIKNRSVPQKVYCKHNLSKWAVNAAYFFSDSW